ncbi:MAG: DUF2264 domain-containing protein [Phycisphaeraceae bacterium]|nr:DUF2264 domain-containing protein [Phycisphaeraceae bacterium]
MIEVRNDRAHWVSMLERLCRPVLEAMAKGELHQRMPSERHVQCDTGRLLSMRLEAAGRILAGIGPWLGCQGLGGREGALQSEFRQLLRRALVFGTDPEHPDYWGFAGHRQAVVDTAFLAQGLLRAGDGFNQLVDSRVREPLIRAMVHTRDQLPVYNNWLLFAACTEACLKRLGVFWDRMRIDYALRQHEMWYVGDGHYADGPSFHFDYYNSFVIQPMMLDVLEAVGEQEGAWNQMLPRLRVRFARCAAIQERLIAPDGSWPATGRSITYRSGAFAALATAAWKGLLPEGLPAGQVRSALSAVIRRSLDEPKNYDSDGWLRIGLMGRQPSLGEPYITTGSLYLASFIFAPLGLAPDEPFWTEPAAPWTSVRLWELGQDMAADHALHE